MRTGLYFRASAMSLDRRGMRAGDGYELLTIGECCPHKRRSRAEKVRTTRPSAAAVERGLSCHRRGIRRPIGRHPRSRAGWLWAGCPLSDRAEYSLPRRRAQLTQASPWEANGRCATWLRGRRWRCQDPGFGHIHPWKRRRTDEADVGRAAPADDRSARTRRCAGPHLASHHAERVAGGDRRALG